jgi:hypothetical protein
VSVFLFVLLALGAARITWLITEDHLPVIAKPRQRIVDRNPEGNLAYLINCWWCTSVYVGAGAAAFATWVLHSQVVPVPWKSFLVLWPAFSMAAVMLMGAGDWLTSAPDDE